MIMNDMDLKYDLSGIFLLISKFFKISEQELSCPQMVNITF